jgi:hypothetical protein
MPTKVMGGDVIEILDDEEEEAINESVREEVLMKLEPFPFVDGKTHCALNHGTYQLRH